MSFRNKLKYFLVHQANLPNEEAQKLIESGNVFVNRKATSVNLLISEKDEIVVNGLTLQYATKHKYFLFYKPKGIETTHNPSIKESLINFFPQAKDLFFAGRLDKDSEGLLFLTTDGKLVNDLSHPVFQKEKEYLVKVDSELNDEFKTKMESGIEIMGSTTAPCEIKLMDKNSFLIILKEGKNRQIRRMCYKLGYTVVELKRIRIANWEIDNMKPGEIREVLL